MPVPQPTLTVDEKQALVRKMLQDNGGCELPCWWGIVPGQTDWQILRNRFTTYGGTFFNVPSTPPVDYDIFHSFTQQNGIVKSIQVTGEARGGDRFAKDWQRYSLDQVLTRYGVPSQVWLFLNPAVEPGSGPNYGLTVAYDQPEVSIYFEGPASIKGAKTHICPLFKQVRLMMLQLGPITQSTSGAPSIFPEGNPFVQSLEEATGMSLETFHETFMNSNSRACLDALFQWPP